MEYTVCFEDEHFVLVGAGGAAVHVLRQGDSLELFEYGCFQPVTVCHGGYNGWYYVTADGRPARFAIGMQARMTGIDAPTSSPVSVSSAGSQTVNHVQWCPCKKSRCEYPDCPLGDPRSVCCAVGALPQNDRDMRQHVTRSVSCLVGEFC